MQRLKGDIHYTFEQIPQGGEFSFIQPMPRAWRQFISSFVSKSRSTKRATRYREEVIEELL